MRRGDYDYTDRVNEQAIEKQRLETLREEAQGFKDDLEHTTKFWDKMEEQMKKFYEDKEYSDPYYDNKDAKGYERQYHYYDNYGRPTYRP